MAAGGIFTIITNDGKQDRMLMATALLHDRLDKIWQSKSQMFAGAGVDPDDVRVLPSLIDIEKTHILFTNAHFKPFAAIGFEYNKVRPTSGSPTLGTQIQFSIPQFGDFFHDIAFHCKLAQPTVTVTSGTLNQNKPAMRWCTWPGERLLKKVQQEVNGNPLDEYTLHATALHREYRVAPNKLTAWRRCVGQEEALQGYVRQRDWTDNGNTGESFRVGAQVFNGAQTPTPSKSGYLELFVPLLFWYNKDVRLAVPSVAIPYGQRFINIELAQAYELVGLVPRGTGTWADPNGTFAADPVLSDVELYINNIFVNPEVHKIYIKRVGFSLIRVHRQQITTLASNQILLQQLKWPIEYLFVGAKLRDYYASSAVADRNQNLQAWDKYSSYEDNVMYSYGQSAIRETALVYDPTTTLGITITSGAATLAGTATAAQAMPVGTTIRVNGTTYTTSAAVASATTALSGIAVTPPIAASLTASALIAANSAVVVQSPTEYQAKSWTPLLDTIGIQAHGIDIYKEIPGKFFNAYTTYHYGGSNINAPSDPGALFVPFCLYPGTYQPSGHINISRAREFYLNYTSAYQVANSSAALLLVVVASAINFLLISDGSAVLRYST